MLASCGRAKTLPSGERADVEAKINDMRTPGSELRKQMTVYSRCLRAHYCPNEGGGHPQLYWREGSYGDLGPVE